VRAVVVYLKDLFKIAYQISFSREEDIKISGWLKKG
jgi:hypothetical protein